MILSRDMLKFLVEDFDIIFPEPDPNARIEDSIGIFSHLFPKDKSSVQIIREMRGEIFEPEKYEMND